jgi:hypothetical protein
MGAADQSTGIRYKYNVPVAWLIRGNCRVQAVLRTYLFTVFIVYPGTYTTNRNRQRSLSYFACRTGSLGNDPSLTHPKFHLIILAAVGRHRRQPSLQLIASSPFILLLLTPLVRIVTIDVHESTANINSTILHRFVSVRSGDWFNGQAGVSTFRILPASNSCCIC